jgi:hypothetical protein
MVQIPSSQWLIYFSDFSQNSVEKWQAAAGRFSKEFCKNFGKCAKQQE